MGEFRFYTRLNLVRLLGLRARCISELYEGIKKIPPAAIYHHTHRFLQQHSYLSPEPPNDFAYWVTNSLKIKDLGERLASIDTVRFTKIEDLRKEFLRILEDWLGAHRGVTVGSISHDEPFLPGGEEFNFMSCVTFVIPTNYAAKDVKEFEDALLKITADSLYFHIFEARLRLGKDENDFSLWFRDMGKTKIADEITRLDPYNITLDGLRKKILELIRIYG